MMPTESNNKKNNEIINREAEDPPETKSTILFATKSQKHCMKDSYGMLYTATFRFILINLSSYIKSVSQPIYL